MSEFSKQDIAELNKILAEKREALRAFRFGGAGSRTRNVREGRNLRREVAQILTELRARDLSLNTGIASKAKTA